MSQNQQQQQHHMQQKQQQLRQEEQTLENQQTIGEKKHKKKRNKRKSTQDNVKEVVAGTEADSNNSVGDNSLPLSSTDNQRSQMAKPVTPIANRKAAGSNWQLAIANVVPAKENKNKNNDAETAVKVKNGENVSPSTATAPTLSKAQRHRQKRRAAQQRHVAMDCEMVGVGHNGVDDMLARVSIVNKRGEVLLDKFVKPQETVVDYRTSVSGIRPHDMDNGEDMSRVQEEVIQILQGKVLIGHGINKDLSVLRIKHPHSNIRDTAFYKPLRRLVSNGRTPSLKRLALAILGKEIQSGEHNSVEDARAVMSIYNCLASDWEQYIKRHQRKGGK